VAVWSTVRVSQLPGAFRMDAQFWQPNHVAMERALRGLPCKPLGELVSSLRKGVFDLLAADYVDEGVPFYRSANVGQILPRDNDLVFITDKRDQAEEKTSLRRGDLMIAKTGTEAASVVLCPRCNVSQDVIAIRVKRNSINPFYLAVYLNTRAGISQMQRWFQGQSQLHLSLPDTRQFLVPILKEETQKEVEKAVVKAESVFHSATASYSEAEELLLSSLGLDGLNLGPKLSYVRRYRDTVKAQRIDAEYFSPRYQKIFAKLHEGGKTIRDVVSLARRKFDPKAGVPFNYIEIGGLTSGAEIFGEILDGADAPSRAQWVVHPNDVITSTVRPIRRLSALIDSSKAGYVCSSGFAVLQPITIEPEVLLTYLRLRIICELLDLNTTASMYPAISEERLLSIPIAIPSPAARKRIVEKVQESFAARDRANQLLEKAKSIVDKAILGSAG
jgi:type I restriction enzyme M protein